MLRKIFYFKNIEIIFILLLFLITPITNRDIFWQVRSGDYIITTHQIPQHPLFNFMDTAHKWVDHEWLSQIYLSLIYKFTGTLGLIIFKIAVFMLIFLIILKFSYNEKNYSLWKYLFILSAIMLMSNRFIIRPEILGYLFITLTIFLVESGRFRWWHSLFILIWANLHPSFSFIILIFFVYFFVSLDKKFLISLIIAIVAGLVTPYGFGLYRRMLLEMRSPFIKYVISEWGSPFLFMKGPINYYMIIYFIFAAVVLFLTVNKIIKHKKISALDIITLIFFALSLSAIRFIPIFVIISLLSLGKSMPASMQLNAIGRSLIFALFAVFILTNSAYKFLGSAKYFGLGINKERFSIQSINYLKSRENLQFKRVFCDYGSAGYFEFYFWKRAKVFIDGSFISTQNIKNYFQVLAYPSLLNNLGIDLFYLDYTNKSIENLVQYLFKTKWRFVFLDDRVAIFSKPNSNQKVKTKIWNYNTPKALFRESTFLLKNQLPASVISLLNIHKKQVDNSYYLLNNLGVAYALEADPDKSKIAFLRSLKVKPRQIRTSYNLGFLYIKERKFDKALYYMRKVYKIRKDAQIKNIIDRIIKIRNLSSPKKDK